jgi:murein DD-endopeptidase MepM/ murein hydrolase activator NlpD
MRLACLAIAFAWASVTGADELYRLPWPEGLSFMFIQAPGGRITTHFTKATLHAVDVAMPEGVPVLAARDGTVEALEIRYGASAEEEPLSYEGNYVRVRHADGTAAIYAHLEHKGVAVAVGEAIKRGQVLGYSGATGDVTEPQLHFTVIRQEKNSSGWPEDVSLPVVFYVGVPPVAFSPRTALRVTANYSSPAAPPRAPSEGSPLAAWQRPALAPGDETAAWLRLAIWLACGVAALVWFWKFSKG